MHNCLLGSMFPQGSGGSGDWLVQLIRAVFTPQVMTVRLNSFLTRTSVSTSFNNSEMLLGFFCRRQCNRLRRPSSPQINLRLMATIRSSLPHEDRTASEPRENTLEPVVVANVREVNESIRLFRLNAIEPNHTIKVSGYNLRVMFRR